MTDLIAMISQHVLTTALIAVILYLPLRGEIRFRYPVSGDGS